ncbi:MAG: glycosyltransferase, partial [Caulobacteraceae bacterium]
MIAVIIPTLNEAAHIEGLLRQLLDEAPATLVEIIVADGGSTDGTREIVSKVALTDPRVRLIFNPLKIQAAGFNLAAAAAAPRATVLIRIDAHSGYPPHVVQSLSEQLVSMDADSVVVRLRTGGDGCFQKAVAAVSNSILGTGAAAHRVGG